MPMVPTRRIWFLLLLLAAAEPTWCQDLGGSVGYTTDYVFRGISQTRGGPAAQADLHYQGRAGWFAGVWASQIEAPLGGVVELKGYLGADGRLDRNWVLRSSYVRYVYPDAYVGLDYDYDYAVLGLSHRDRWSLELGWSPNLVSAKRERLGRGQAYLAELTWRQPLRHGVALALGGGYYDLRDVLDATYASYSATLSYTRRQFELDLGRFGTSAAGRRLYGAETAGDRWALSAAWSF